MLGLVIGIPTFVTVIGIIVAAIIAVLVAAWQKDKLKCCKKRVPKGRQLATKFNDETDHFVPNEGEQGTYM